MNVKPGIITLEEFHRFMVVVIWTFVIFMVGVMAGARIERRAFEKTLNDHDIQLIYPHQPTVEGRYNS